MRAVVVVLLLVCALGWAEETTAPVEPEEPVVQPSADWEELTKATYEKLENSTDRWNVVFHDSSPRFQVLNELAAWAKTEIKDRPFRFGHVNVEKETELAAALEVDYVPLMVTIVDGQIHDFYSYLNDKAQLEAWLQGGYVISSPFVAGEASDEDFTQEELDAMEKEIANGEESFQDEESDAEAKEAAEGKEANDL